jgi:hypothetical protein
MLQLIVSEQLFSFLLNKDNYNICGEKGPLGAEQMTYWYQIEAE